jgi:chorismate synthase
VECQIQGLPVGLGEPVYGKFSAVLAASVFSINAVKGFEIGSGFSCVTMPGSEHNDVFDIDSSGNIITHTNHSGGIQGGMTNGMPVIFRVAFKPTSSIGKKQKTLDESGQPTEIEIQGRHDPCVAIRAVPVVEAMAALVCADMLLISRMNKVKF